jgi:hypothetical protein
VNVCLASSNGLMPLHRPPGARRQRRRGARSPVHPLRLLLRCQNSRSLPRLNKAIKFLQAIHAGHRSAGPAMWMLPAPGGEAGPPTVPVNRRDLKFWRALH